MSAFMRNEPLRPFSVKEASAPEGTRRQNRINVGATQVSTLTLEDPSLQIVKVGMSGQKANYAFVNRLALTQ